MVVPSVLAAWSFLAAPRSTFAQTSPEPASATAAAAPSASADASELSEPSALLPKGPVDEAPPATPRWKGFVAQTSIGAMGFAGSFGAVARPAWMFDLDVGYEIFRWLMVLGYGELALTDTGVKDGPTQKRGVPFFGFGGGLRGKVHVSPRVALSLQATAGAMQADVPSGTLVNLGYGALESLGFVVGGRFAVEWYQVDPHLAFSLAGGARYGSSFAQAGAPSDLPLIWDAGLAFRYTF